MGTGGGAILLFHCDSAPELELNEAFLGWGVTC